MQKRKHPFEPFKTVASHFVPKFFTNTLGAKYYEKSNAILLIPSPEGAPIFPSLMMISYPLHKITLQRYVVAFFLLCGYVFFSIFSLCSIGPCTSRANMS